METILSAISHLIINTISTLGYSGVALLMALESANIPLPSEVILPFSGFLVSLGRFNIHLVVLFATIGQLLGSNLSYWLGRAGGRPLIERYGKYVLLSHHDLDLADRWFKKYGDVSIFFSRLLPIVRTFISFPAGISEMNLFKFNLFTFLGVIPWSYFLAYVGVKMGENWESLKIYFRKFDVVIGALVILGIVWWVARHVRNSKLKT